MIEQLKQNDTLQTPDWVFSELGAIDLDPCASIDTNIGKINYRIEDGECGLKNDWFGFVFCNPPFSQKKLWIEKMISHSNGVLLLPERGSAPWFGQLAHITGYYWVMGKKINFVGGTANGNNIGSVLFPFGTVARNRLLQSKLPGHFVKVVKYNTRKSTV